MRRSLSAVALLTCIAQTQVTAQEPTSPAPVSAATSAAGWTWTTDASVFVGRNYQLRHFADYSAWESQNWFALTGRRVSESWQLTAHVMLSLEPFTMHARGSPQLFQTGESHKRIPLVNFQHPHDLLMNLGVTYRLPRPRVTYVLGADVVGPPTLGPAPFMHRASARDNPQVPLMHHYLDSTHSTPGVLRAGLELGSFAVETSVFRGEGPDENRLNVEQPRLNSWAARAVWHRGPWQVQMSGGRLRQPEWFEPFDATRLTASISFEGDVWSRPLAMTLAWGENRQFNGFNGNVDGYLLEWDLLSTPASTVYGRVEVGAKELFGLGPHSKASVHPHWFSQIAAFTAGYIRDVAIPRVGRVGAGADITTYRMAPDLQPYYASSRSFHVFVRWRPIVSTPHVH